jgi:SAM-dependent methyltransferase
MSSLGEYSAVSKRSTAKRRKARRWIYPEQHIASFARDEGRFLFFSIIANLVSKNAVVLDLGAGRGTQIETSRGYMRQLMSFRGRCLRFIGVDMDPAVTTNPHVDEAYVMGADGRIPLPDESVDVAYSFAVLEHVADPERFAREVDRVLKPGGWFCAWTPNKWGYVGIAVRLVPNALHARLASAAEPQDGRDEKDVFPTAYRLNTLSAIRRYFPEERFKNHSFLANGSPSYHFGRRIIARFWQLTMLLSPSGMAKALFVFVQKSGA